MRFPWMPRRTRSAIPLPDSGRVATFHALSSHRLEALLLADRSTSDADRAEFIIRVASEHTSLDGAPATLQSLLDLPALDLVLLLEALKVSAEYRATERRLDNFLEASRGR